ncbi:MAG TPA: LamG-like jellyroll fold domain-containing protein, partial [Terriglobales bacterium]
MQAIQPLSGRALSFLLLLSSIVPVAIAQIVPTNDPPVYGPYNAVILEGGDGLRKHMVERDTVLRADSPWTMYAWINVDLPATAPELVAGYGDVSAEYARYLGLDAGKLMLWAGPENSLSAPAAITPDKWQFVAATFDGAQFRLYSDGAQVGQGSLTLGRVAPTLQLAPTAPLPVTPIATPPLPNAQHFAGKIAGFTIVRDALAADKIKQLASSPPNFALVEFEEGSKPWYVQTRGQAGYRAPQDPATWPKSRAPYPAAVAKPVPTGPALRDEGDNRWQLASGWVMAAAPLKVSVEAMSKPGFAAQGWLAATVPGTALTTMIDRGVYPDSDYGLNNLVIPETLNKQDYWYRNEFKAPKPGGRRFTLTFEGINYAAEVWLNGQSLGNIKGAFIRGMFDVTELLKPGQTNVLLVRVSPPPHPGIPHEQSILGGPGENGGIMCLDGPTFVATEGWDWIPAIRDRDT